MTLLDTPSANGVVASNWRIGVHVTMLPATSSTGLDTSGGNAVSSMTGHSESLHGWEPRERPEPGTDGRARKVALSAFQSCNEIRPLVLTTPAAFELGNQGALLRIETCPSPAQRVSHVPTSRSSGS